jgi:Mg2+ and Co2+ transporter CorA
MGDDGADDAAMAEWLQQIDDDLRPLEDAYLQRTIADTEIVKRLRAAASDPISEDHAEVPKYLLVAAYKEIARNKVALGNCHKEIFKLRETLLRHAQ